MTPTSVPEARHKEITNIENQNVFNEVYRTPDMKVISGRWVDTETGPGVAKARWVLRGFEEKADRDDCYAATASLPSVRMLLTWAAAMRNEKYKAYIEDVAAAFLNANLDDGETTIAQPPPEWQPRRLDPKREVVWELRARIFSTNLLSSWDVLAKTATKKNARGTHTLRGMLTVHMISFFVLFFFCFCRHPGAASARTHLGRRQQASCGYGPQPINTPVPAWGT